MSNTSGLLVNYIVLPRLDRIAFIKIASNLWCSAGARDLILKYFDIPKENRNWQEIEEKVVEKLEELILPRFLKNKLLYFLKPVGVQIRDWIEEELQTNSCHLIIPNNFCWTLRGTLDRKNTAQMLVKIDEFCVYRRYELACFYCLEADVFILSEMMREHENQSCKKKMKKSFYVDFWSSCTEVMIAMQKQYENTVPFIYAFRYAVSAGNEVATKYFFGKLTAEDKKPFLVSCTIYVARSCCSHTVDTLDGHNTDVMAFLLSVMNRDEQIEVMKNHSYFVLKSLLAWPWHSCFIETAYRIWTALSKVDCYNLLHDISESVGCYKDNFKELFGHFWRRMTPGQKEYALQQIILRGVILQLFERKNKENIKLLMDYAAEREIKIIFTTAGDDVCWHLFRNDEWDLFKFFLQDCEQCTSVADVIRLKGDCKLHFEHFYSKDKWNKFIEILDEVAEGIKKR